jgi:hypothetical protein
MYREAFRRIETKVPSYEVRRGRGKTSQLAPIERPVSLLSAQKPPVRSANVALFVAVTNVRSGSIAPVRPPPRNVAIGGKAAVRERGVNVYSTRVLAMFGYRARCLFRGSGKIAASRWEAVIPQACRPCARPRSLGPKLGESADRCVDIGVKPHPPSRRQLS